MQNLTMLTGVLTTRGGFGVQFLAQGHSDMRTGGACEDGTADPVTTGTAADAVLMHCATECATECHTSGKHSWSVGVAEKLSYSWSATDLESLLSLVFFFFFLFPFNITLKRQGTAFDNLKFICWPDTEQSGSVQLVQRSAKTQDAKLILKDIIYTLDAGVKLVRCNN